MRGALCGKKRSILEFWDKHWGVQLFPNTMGRNRFCKIMRFFRFDMRSTRLSGPQSKKLALISAVWDKFVDNFINYYKPGKISSFSWLLMKILCKYILVKIKADQIH